MTQRARDAIGEEWLPGSVLSTASWPRHHTLACSPPHGNDRRREKCECRVMYFPLSPLMWLL